jgi:hypothetical protein
MEKNQVDILDGTPDVLAALAHEYRWQTIQQLAESDDQICTVDGVIEAISAADGITATSDERERIRLRLYHVDLPKLAYVGLVEYDWRSGDILYTGDTPAPELVEAIAEIRS